MLFWTIVFITFYLFLLFKPYGLNAFQGKNGELQIKLANAKTDEEKKAIAEEQGKIILPYLLLIPFIIAEFIYLISAISIDVYKYPSIAMLFYMIIASAIGAKIKDIKKYDLTTEEGQIKYRKQIYKGRTLKGYLFNLIYLTYFGYMFYILVF
jgi:hypothetical protein